MPSRLLTLIVLAALVAGCSGTVGKDKVRSAEGSITGLTVSGTPGTAPVVRMAAPLKSTGTETVVEGTGPVLLADQQFVLELTMYDARSGKKGLSSYDPGRSPEVVKSTTMDQDLARELVGQRQGTRVVRADGSTVLIADIVAVPPAQTVDVATGTTKAPPAGLPRVVLRAGLPSKLDFTASPAKPSGLVAVSLIEGDGPKVRDDSLVTLRTISQVWGRRTPFDDTFIKEPIVVPVGLGKVVAAWDRALVGVPRGSRLLILAPPRLAFGDVGYSGLVPADATVGYVIDVLGVS